MGYIVWDISQIAKINAIITIYPKYQEDALCLLTKKTAVSLVTVKLHTT